MNLRYLYTLLILGMAITVAPASAQTKKAAAKTKTSAKPAAKKPVTQKATVAPNKAAAQKLGDAVTKTAADTTKKGGQTTDASGVNKSSGNLQEEIVVTTDYKPVLADAVKIRRNPDLEDKTPFKAPLTYTTLDKRLERNTDIKQMEAAKMSAERDSVPYNNYVKAGLGSLKSTYGELYVNNGQDDALQAGVYIKHFAQQGTAYYKQNQSRDEVSVFGKSVGEVNSLHGSITYNHEGNYFYGYDPFAPPPVLHVDKQHFSTISAEGDLTKNYKDVDRDFTYALKLSGYAFSNAFQGRENNVVLSGFINQTVKQFYAGLNGSIDLSTQKDSLYSLSNNLLRLNPYLKFQGNNYKIDAGVNIVSEFGFSTRFFIFPAAKLELQVVPKYVRLFVEAKGDVNKSSLRDFYNTNPFLGNNLNIQNSVDQLDLAAGLKGTLAPGLGFKASVFRNEVKNLPLMISNFDFTNGYNRFAVIYDQGRAKISGFDGELDYKESDDVSIFGRIEVKDYKLASEQEPWNLPKLKLTAGTNLNISNKVTLNGSLVFRGDTKDITSDPTLSTGGTPRIISVKSFADINAGVEYKVTPRAGVFVRVNNLLNGGNQSWLYYPDYGFNILGGVSYGF